MNIPGLLLVAFIVLKLTGVIEWSWFWVLAPLWVWIALLFVVTVAARLEAGRIHRRFRQESLRFWSDRHEGRRK